MDMMLIAAGNSSVIYEYVDVAGVIFDVFDGGGDGGGVGYVALEGYYFCGGGWGCEGIGGFV